MFHIIWKYNGTAKYLWYFYGDHPFNMVFTVSSPAGHRLVCRGMVLSSMGIIVVLLALQEISSSTVLSPCLFSHKDGSLKMGHSISIKILVIMI
jgi:hypothetical protein